MTDPIRLAEEIENAKRWYINGHNGETRLIAAALRLAEADCALMDHDDNSIHRKPGEMQAWSDERDVLIGRHADAEAAYRAAREGRP